MSTCSRCGAGFGCAMVDGSDGPCWCTRLAPALPLPRSSPDQGVQRATVDTAETACWCPACLEAEIARRARTREA